MFDDSRQQVAPYSVVCGPTTGCGFAVPAVFRNGAWMPPDRCPRCERDLGVLGLAPMHLIDDCTAPGCSCGFSGALSDAAHALYVERRAAYDFAFQRWEEGGCKGPPPPRPIPPHTPA